TENVGEGLPAFVFHLDQLTRGHRGALSPQAPRRRRRMRPCVLCPVRPSLGRKLATMELKRWPRKNDPGSIEARQKALGLSDGVTRIDLAPFVNAQEMLTGAAVIPVSVVGPLQIDLGEYELEEPFGRVAETSRNADQVFVPLAHTEGG